VVCYSYWWCCDYGLEGDKDQDCCCDCDDVVAVVLNRTVGVVGEFGVARMNCCGCWRGYW